MNGRPPPGLRIALVAPLYSPHAGGIETHVACLARGLADLGQSVTVLTQEPAFRSGPPARDEVDGVPVRRFRSVTGSRAYPVAPGLLAHLRSVTRPGPRSAGGPGADTPGTDAAGSGFDLVHVHGYHAAAALGALAVPRATPVVFTPHYHGGGHTPFARALHVAHRPLGRRLMRRSDAVVAVSEAERALLAEHFPGVVARTTVIHNGIKARARSGPPSTSPVLLSISRLERYKRLDLAISALKRLPPDWSLHIVGTGSQRAELDGLIRAEGLDGRVRIDQDLTEDQMAAAISGAWAFVSMSEHEAFGLTVLESAALGVPAVVSDIPAHRELSTLAPGSVTVAPGGPADPAAVAQLILAAAPRPPDPAAGPPTWLRALGWPAVGRQTLDLYHRTLGPPPAP